jgi:hypothetical protein
MARVMALVGRGKDKQSPIDMKLRMEELKDWTQEDSLWHDKE